MDSNNPNDKFDQLIDELDKTGSQSNSSYPLIFLLVALGLAATAYFSYEQGRQTTAAKTLPSSQITEPTVQSTKNNVNTPPSKQSEQLGIKTNFESDHNNKANQPAQFPGGSNAIAVYLKENIVYPDEAFEKKIEGKVLVQVTIDKEGRVNSPSIIEGLGFGCDEEVSRVLSSMPRWIPAQANKKPVTKSYILTVSFSLD